MTLPTATLRWYRIPCHFTSISTLIALLAVLSPVAAAGDEEQDRARAYSFALGDCGGDGEAPCPDFFFGGRGGFLGLQLNGLSEELRAHFGAPGDAGVLVAKVLEDTPAERAGLMVGDVIVAVDGRPVASTAQLGRIVRGAEEGDVLAIDIVRDGEGLRLEATVVQRERVAVDLGEMISGALAGVDWEQIGEELPKALEEMDLGGLAMRGTLSAEAMAEALEGTEHLFESESWQRFMESVAAIDHEALEAQMKALRERLETLERRLEAHGEREEE